MVEFLRCQRLGLDYDPARLGTIAHVHELLQLMHVMTGDNNFETAYDAEQMRDGETTMCDVLDRVVNRGITIGREQGVSIGREQGLSIGREQGEAELAMELNELLRRGNMEEVMRITGDPLYRQQYMDSKRARNTH